MLRLLHLVAAVDCASALLRQKTEAAHIVSQWQHGSREPSTRICGQVLTRSWRVKD